MRLVRLAVKRFQCIESAELELGPHLNVLYGPNDLGKSSLAWAIRAVLLVPHGSSHAERFASWYDAGPPQVALTLCDDSGRYWRVTKVFGGSAGRSTLESSKDGRTFTAEASAREVDKRLRELLRWGLAAPGGQGRTVFPESFLTQVLLADQSQDSVRKILFDAKLDKDPDDTGRERLVAALGALAQDPLFKQVLDQADGRVAQAFTPRGQRKRAAGSPWVETSERISRLRHEQEDLERQVKSSAEVEERIKLLHGQRDGLQARVEETALRLQVAERQLAARLEHDRLAGEAAVLDHKVREVEQVKQQLEAATGRVQDLDRRGKAAADDQARTATASANAEARLAEVRKRLDSLAHANPEAARADAALQDAVRAADQRGQGARARVDVAQAALQSAIQLAGQLRDADAAARAASRAATDAELVAVDAARSLAEAEQALDAARARQREVHSGDQVQARALRRQELENQRLSLESRRGELTVAGQRAQQVGDRHAALGLAEAAARSATAAVETSRAGVAAIEVALGKLETSRRTLVQVESYGRLRGLREQVEQARQARAEADHERQRAVDLRQAAERRRSELRTDLPSSERLAALRGLRDDLRLAEARLGGGLSVVLRPRRSLTVRATRDGTAEAAVTSSEPVALSAKRTLTLQLDDLLELEVTAGEEAARQKAAELRTRWLREGEAVLVEHGAPALEELEALRARSDDAERAIAQLDRDAEIAVRRAGSATGDDGASLEQQLAAADAELAGADREELATRLARLGDPWQVGLRKRASELDAELATQRARLAREREDAAGHVARAASQHAAVVTLKDELARAQAALAEPWAVTVATCKAELSSVVRELAEVERVIASLSSGDSRAGEVADAAVVAGHAAVEAARAARAQAQTAATTARDAQVRTATRLETVRAAARDLDGTGPWSSVLDAGGCELPLATWEQARRDATGQVTAADAALVAARAALAAAQDAHRAALDQLRQEVEAADVAAAAARDRADAAAAAHRERLAEHGAAVVAHAELRVAIASVNLDEAHRAIADLRGRMRALEPEIGGVDPAVVAALASGLARQRGELRELDDELARARGALEHVGGAIVRERLVEVGLAVRRAVERERELEIEYEAWRLLQTTLRETESSESAHLGRALAGPVSARFRHLTGGRYGELELGAQLEAGGILVAGALREIEALSAGTQDQLATLLRVCIAQQLRSAIVLDDHLSQSDAGRVAWFNTMLREAAEQVQIVLITCRPQEVLAPAELAADGPQPAPPTGRVHAVNLAAVIRRFPATARPAAS